MFEINLGDESSRIAKAVLHYSIKFLDNNKRLSGQATSRRQFKVIDIEYLLPFGENSITYEERKLIVQYTRMGEPVDVSGMMKYYCEVVVKDNNSESIDFLKGFLEKAKKYYNDEILKKDKDKDKITINMFDEYWEELRKLPKRKISTIYLDDAEVVLKDMKKFLSKETEEKYTRLGIPYKKNYLFEGIPGTGKSSLVFSLASELNKDICIVNFDHKTTDSMFTKALTRLSDDEILVLEDIDVLFSTDRKKNKDSISPITFSGLLNALDGLGHQDKLVTIMTTNYKCNLDSAMKRPGRIDFVVHFDYAKESQIKKMFENFLPEQKEKFKEFYLKIKGKDVTTSVLQQYLFENMENDDIMTNIKDLFKYIEENNYDKREVNMYM